MSCWYFCTAKRKRALRAPLHLPCGQDAGGQALYVEVLDLGVKERFTSEEFLDAVPVTFEQTMPDNKIKVIWGNNSSVLWARLGRFALPGATPASAIFTTAPARPMPGAGISLPTRDSVATSLPSSAANTTKLECHVVDGTLTSAPPAAGEEEADAGGCCLPACFHRFRPRKKPNNTDQVHHPVTPESARTPTLEAILAPAGTSTDTGEPGLPAPPEIPEEQDGQPPRFLRVTLTQAETPASNPAPVAVYPQAPSEPGLPDPAHIFDCSRSTLPSCDTAEYGSGPQLPIAQPRPRLEAHIVGSTYDQYGRLPHPKSGFSIRSNNTGKDVVWWASTIWRSSQRPGQPYFLVLRHTLLSLQRAIKDNVCLQIVTDHAGISVGAIGTPQFPMPDINEAECLADGLPQAAVDRFHELEREGLAMPEPAMLYDLLLIPCRWNMSLSQLRSLTSCFGPCLGHFLHMRSFDRHNPLRNGVTSGLVPDTPENRDRVRQCGIVVHQISNSHGGSGSFAWEGENCCLMHVGSKGDNLNYGIPGHVLKQLEHRWLGGGTTCSTMLGFQRFVEGMQRNAEAAVAVAERFPPSHVGDSAPEALAHELATAAFPPSSELEAIGSKRDVARRHAIASSGGAGLKALAKRDYKQARDLVRNYKVAVNPGSNIMAMLYYWLESGDSEEYDYRWTKRDRDDPPLSEEDWRDAEAQFNEFVGEHLWTGAHYNGIYPGVNNKGLVQPREDPVVVRPPALSEPVVLPPEPPKQPSLHSLIPGEIREFMSPEPKPKPSLEAPAREITVTQVPAELCSEPVAPPSYASSIGGCNVEDFATPQCIEEFDALCDTFLSDPSELSRCTMTELYKRCEGKRFRGSLRGSRYWNKYIGVNVIPEEATASAPPVNNATPKARAKYSGKNRRFTEPEFKGLYKEFAEWNWDAARDLAKGVLPPLSPKDVKASLNRQLRPRDSCQGLDPRTVPTLAAGYPARVWDGEETVVGAIKRHFDALVLEKGVGWHLPPGITSKRAYVEDPSCVPATVVKLLLVLTTSYDWSAFATPWQLYQAGLVMPEVLKIKDEPVKRSKADLESWRLIWQTCITQEILSRLLQGDQNQAEVSAYQAGMTHSEAFPTFGNAAGMGHHTPGLEHTRDAMVRLLGGDSGCAADRKAWDMSISRHGWVADGDLRAVLAEAGGAPPEFVEAQRKMVLILSAHVVQIGAWLYQVDTFGIVGSGILSTASSNGHINQLFALDYGVTLITSNRMPTFEEICRFLSLVMGDDSLMKACPEDVEGFIAHHAARGIQVTGSDKGTKPGPILDMGEVPFTSHAYDLLFRGGPAAFFTNVEKLSWGIAARKSMSREQAMGNLFAVRYSPHRDLIRSMIVSANPGLSELQYNEGAMYTLAGFL